MITLLTEWILFEIFVNMFLQGFLKSFEIRITQIIVGNFSTKSKIRDDANHEFLQKVITYCCRKTETCDCNHQIEFNSEIRD